MIRALPIETLYGDSPFFVDWVRGVSRAVDRFAFPPDGAAASAAARRRGSYPRDALVDLLLDSNRRIGATEETCSRIESLRDSTALCVVSGQQAGFLGGPAYTAYKIQTTIHLARKLERLQGSPVVPVFWLASEDHDLAEIQSVRVVDGGRIETLRFDADDHAGRPAETLAVSAAMRALADRLLAAAHPEVAEVFRPAPSDDYATWHARIWSRCFQRSGLVVVEPRVLRPLAADLLVGALERADAVADALHEGAAALRAAGYPIPLDPASVGRPFRFDADGRRRRVSADDLGDARRHPESLSADVALRPVLADALLPTVANVLGPSELSYHAMLLPLYRTLGISQPLPVARHGYTLLSAADRSLLDRLGITDEPAVDPQFDPRPALDRLIPSALRQPFDRAGAEIRAAFAPLHDIASSADPGLVARYRQAVDRATGEVDQLRERVERAALARSGVSPRAVRAIAASLRPGGGLQERVLSFVGLARRFGLEWLEALPGSEDPERFGHWLVAVEGDGWSTS